MKTLLLFSLIIPTTLLFGQITNHFSHQDAKWHVAESYPAATQEYPSFVATTTTVFGIQGDSTINGETWSKIYSTADSLFQNNLVFEGLTQVKNDFILFKNGTSPVDTLYNFNLNVGDSVFYDFGYFTSWIHVEEIQTLQINGESYRKFIFTEPTGPTAFDHLSEVWIEGIGSIHGPFFPQSPRKFSEETPDSMVLTCSFSNNQDYFQHTSYSTCYVDITLGLKNQEVQSFNIYPNPAQSMIKVDLDQSSTGTIEIHDINGKRVTSIKSKGQTVEIDVSTLDNGTYFLHFNSGSKKVIRKILIHQ